MNTAYLKLFLRLALSTAFLSAVADRFGLWPASHSVWGSWEAFLTFTQQINPWLPSEIIPYMGGFATFLEVVLGLFLLLGISTEKSAIVSGFLLLLFALSMTFSLGIKSAFDYSVFTASAAAFALSTFKEKYWELDIKLNKNINPK